MIIDMHAHYYPDAYLARLRSRESPFQVEKDSVSGREVYLDRGGVVLGLPADSQNIDKRLENMDRLGIQTQVLSLAGPSVYYLPGDAARQLAMEVNDATIALCHRMPDRFLAVASVPATDPGLAVAELQRVAGFPEVVGLGLLTNVADKRIDSPLLAPIWDEVNRLQFPVFVHPVTPLSTDMQGRKHFTLSIGFPQETAATISSLLSARVFERYPQTTWVFPHLGGGIHAYWDRLTKAGMLTRLWESSGSLARVTERVYYDCVSSHLPSLQCTIETVGPSQVVFGSDCPHIPIEASLRTLESLKVPRHDKEAILRGNAGDVLKRQRRPTSEEAGYGS